MSSAATATKNDPTASTEPDGNTIYVVSGFRHPKDARRTMEPALCLLPGGTAAARSKLDHSQGESARTSIRDLEQWAKECSQVFMSNFEGHTDPELESDQVQEAFDEWQQDITPRLSVKLQSLLDRTQPEGFVLEMTDGVTEGPGNLEDVTEDQWKSAAPVTLQAQMVDKIPG
jgi:hypothetical protein